MHTGKHKNEEAVLKGGFFKHHGGVFRMHYDDDALQSLHACSAALHKEWGVTPCSPCLSGFFFILFHRQWSCWLDRAYTCQTNRCFVLGVMHNQQGPSTCDRISSADNGVSPPCGICGRGHTSKSFSEVLSFIWMFLKMRKVGRTPEEPFLML